MTDHEDFPTHLDARSGDPRSRASAQVDIHRAVRLLRERDEISESAAFLLLVRASADSGRSVQATASRLVAAHQGALTR